MIYQVACSTGKNTGWYDVLAAVEDDLPREEKSEWSAKMVN